jgi:hypothetical protein
MKLLRISTIISSILPHPIFSALDDVIGRSVLV